eukprot:11207183-Lingulodinium_polyedra.AAC.1
MGVAIAADLADWLQQSIGVRGAPRISRYGRLGKETQEMVLGTTGLVVRVSRIFREGVRAPRGNTPRDDKVAAGGEEY